MKPSHTQAVNAARSRSIDIRASSEAEAEMARLVTSIDRIGQMVIDQLPDAPAEATILALLQVAVRYGIHAGYELDGAVRALRAAWNVEARRHGAS